MQQQHKDLHEKGPVGSSSSKARMVFPGKPRSRARHRPEGTATGTETFPGPFSHNTPRTGRAGPHGQGPAAADTPDCLFLTENQTTQGKEAPKAAQPLRTAIRQPLPTVHPCPGVPAIPTPHGCSSALCRPAGFEGTAPLCKMAARRRSGGRGARREL